MVPMVSVYDAAKSTTAVWTMPYTAQKEILLYDVHKLIVKQKLLEIVHGI
jgi:hypothetical protein